MSGHELRWNPLLDCWIIVAGHRKGRPWHSTFCPFCPGGSETQGEWRVLALPNRYPALSLNPPKVDEGCEPFIKSEALGVCEVVVETPVHEGDFQDIPLEQVSEYILLLGERTRDIASNPAIEYVMPFKNKGVLIGVSLTHPHSQIYAFTFIPPRIVREIESVIRYRRDYGRNLFEDIVEAEIRESKRIVYVNDEFILLLPFYAMWPYEMHIYPLRDVKLLYELDRYSALLLADTIRVATGVYEELFGSEYAYMMIFHQAPIKQVNKDYRLHVEFYTPHLSRDRLKYAAGVEWGAWVFTYDGVPEDRVGELREAARRIAGRLGSLGRIP
ncbi:MAG: galactose-1-phosphate uridylyltransferase [Candidatus Bathyarchaeia archaeon]|nr:galactose-1-phosphate uridylyltransferase [Candidatus Bathyarchaeota archaeon]